MALTDNIVAYWKLDETSGNASDASGNGNTIALTGSPTYVAGKINNGLSFGTSNTTNYGIVESNLGITGGTITVNLWVKVLTAPTPGQVHMLAAHQAGAPAHVSEIITYENVGGTTRLNFARRGENVFTNYALYNTNLGTSSYHMLTYSHDGSTMRLYLDATLVASAASSGNGSSGGHDDFCVGGIWYYAGSLQNVYLNSTITDEVGVWSRALSDAEVSSLYNGGAGLQLFQSSPLVPKATALLAFL